MRGRDLLEALVLNLSLEIAPFGLRACMVKYRAPNPLPEYAEMNTLVKAAALVGDAFKRSGSMCRQRTSR